MGRCSNITKFVKKWKKGQIPTILSRILFFCWSPHHHQNRRKNLNNKKRKKKGWKQSQVSLKLHTHFFGLFMFFVASFEDWNKLGFADLKRTAKELGCKTKLGAKKMDLIHAIMNTKSMFLIFLNIKQPFLWIFVFLLEEKTSKSSTVKHRKPPTEDEKANIFDKNDDISSYQERQEEQKFDINDYILDANDPKQPKSISEVLFFYAKEKKDSQHFKRFVEFFWSFSFYSTTS